MKRKDGRELVTEHPVTGMDMIDYIPRGELPAVDRLATRCAPAKDRGSSRDIDYDDWGA